ncbi:MAG TPA: uridine kinase [Bryobacteraceae bacterium]|nr:uridine kinase [Bryobacteraceae bacterium]
MHLIGIGGHSGSGKTTLARAVAARLNAPILSLDSYYRDLSHLAFEERVSTNFDVPDALDHELLFEHLRSLAAGCEAEIPIYDFSRHCRAEGTERLCAGAFGIIEGLWTLYWEDVRSVLGTRVYLEAADGVCFGRRMRRDVSERGRSPESVTAQYTATVRPMADRYITPTREFADLVLSGIESLDTLAGRVAAHALANAE